MVSIGSGPVCSLIVRIDFGDETKSREMLTNCSRKRQSIEQSVADRWTMAAGAYFGGTPHAALSYNDSE
jgi:hypothetical protein